MNKILIIGADGFIGSNLTSSLLANPAYCIHGIDLHEDKLQFLSDHPNFTYDRADVSRQKILLKKRVMWADVVIPLSAIATPVTYINEPLKVYESVFETNLNIIKLVQTHKKRLIFPSTSEVYGMCGDKLFHETQSNFVLGPIQNQRWIYSCCKQLLDRYIFAAGLKDDLNYTIFRPFNWVGQGIDQRVSDKEISRVISQFIKQARRGEDISLVDGGNQSRSFTDISDGVKALLGIIANPQNICSKKIYNIGNPKNNITIKDLADLILSKLALKGQIPEGNINKKKVVSSQLFYGEGYQDVSLRTPDISAINRDLGWAPTVNISDIIDSII